MSASYGIESCRKLGAVTDRNYAYPLHLHLAPAYVAHSPNHRLYRREVRFPPNLTNSEHHDIHPVVELELVGLKEYGLMEMHRFYDARLEQLEERTRDLVETVEMETAEAYTMAREKIEELVGEQWVELVTERLGIGRRRSGGEEVRWVASVITYHWAAVLIYGTPTRSLMMRTLSGARSPP
jgi:hypothetical protein